MACDVKKTFPRDTPSASRTSWGVRKTPAWKSLYYEYSAGIPPDYYKYLITIIYAFSFTNDEDISLRLSTRRAEERMRHEEHLINMELMRQRVRSTPLLLEGTTSLPNTLTAGAHRCDPPASVAHRVACSVSAAKIGSRNGSSLSNYTDGRFDNLMVNRSPIRPTKQRKHRDG